MSATKPKSTHRSPSRNTLDEDLQELHTAHKLGLKRLRRFASLASKVTNTEKPKAVHDLRVASRRLQQILDYLYPPPRPSTIRRLRSRIRRSRRALGKVRDYDVFIDSLDDRSKSESPARRAALTAFRNRLGKRRAKSMKKAHAVFEKVDTPDLCIQLKKILSANDRQTGAEYFPAPHAEVHRRPIDEALKELWRDFAIEIAESLHGPRPANIHRVRIKAKRLRYLLEVAGELGKRGVDTHLTWLRRLQQYLGEWHDLEVQETILLKMSTRRTVSSKPAHNDALIEMIRKMHTAKTDIEERYLKLVRTGKEWKHLRRWAKHSLPP
jgi:CHAD domain-containing protein